ncbi:MAG: flavodoxin [Turicibacter sp.]|nr:flavodoxin [Turicibacter sp.]
MATKVIYWSGSGNTEAMAEAIAAGSKVEAIRVDSASIDDVKEATTLFLGCSSQGAEELDDTEFLPFLEDASDEFAGKNVVLFGSYDWGEGEWMEAFESQMKGWGANIVEPSAIVNLYPEDEDVERLKALGEKYSA